MLGWESPALIGCDFNLVRSQEDKSNGVVDFKWIDKFNAWVEIWALMEIQLTGRAYTWSNNQEHAVRCRLDRFFCSTNFEAMFPLSHAEALPRLGSDHTPILWDSGCGQIPKKGSFKFEKWWCTKPDFIEIIRKAWNLNIQARNAMNVWQRKVRIFRRLARGWSANLDAEIRRNKKL